MSGSENTINHVYFCLAFFPSLDIHTRMEVALGKVLCLAHPSLSWGLGRGLLPLPGAVSPAKGSARAHPCPLLTVQPQCLQGRRCSVTLLGPPHHPGLRIRVGLVASNCRALLPAPGKREGLRITLQSPFLSTHLPFPVETYDLHWCPVFSILSKPWRLGAAIQQTVNKCL